MNTTYPEAVVLHSRMADAAIWQELYDLHARITDRYVRIGVWTPAQGVQELCDAVMMAGLTTPEGVVGVDFGRLMRDATAPMKLARATCDRILAAETVWVDRDVVSSAVEAGPILTVPPLEILPFVEGAVVCFEESLETFWGERGTKSAEVVGCFFYPVWAADEETLEPKQVLAFRTVAVNPSTGMLFGDSEGFLHPGSQLDVGSLTERQRSVVDGGYRAERLMQDRKQTSVVVQLLHHLANGNDETSIAVVDASNDKSAKRRAAKKGLKPEVNVIYLRRNKGRLLGGGGAARKQRHRVRAHWRWQPYGPRRELRKWTLVKAHERGVGELDGRDRVYVA